ncbi:MAG: DUF3147 family protein [Desulfobacterales bacterium]|nr:DUF3147 family protein [Desulfobacterales bacterium]
MLSFVVGGLWVAGTTFIAEYFGTKIGGIIGGLPSTIVKLVPRKNGGQG